MVNPPPVVATFDDQDRPSPMWIQWFTALFSFIQNLTDYTAASIQAPSTGFSITVGNRTNVLTLNPAGVLATGAITMPASPVDGMPVEVSTTQTVTSLTVSPNTGQTINNAPTTLLAGSGFKYFYNKTAATWYRTY